MNISIEGEPSTSVGLPGRTTDPPPLKFLTASSSAAAMDCAALAACSNSSRLAKMLAA